MQHGELKRTTERQFNLATCRRSAVRFSYMTEAYYLYEEDGQYVYYDVSGDEDEELFRFSKQQASDIYVALHTLLLQDDPLDILLNGDSDKSITVDIGSRKVKVSRADTDDPALLVSETVHYDKTRPARVELVNRLRDLAGLQQSKRRKLRKYELVEVAEYFGVDATLFDTKLDIIESLLSGQRLAGDKTQYLTVDEMLVLLQRAEVGGIDA